MIETIPYIYQKIQSESQKVNTSTDKKTLEYEESFSPKVLSAHHTMSVQIDQTSLLVQLSTRLLNM